MIPPIHKKVVEHLHKVAAHKSPIKFCVTFGILLVTGLSVFGLEHPALVASLLVNMIWIWE